MASGPPEGRADADGPIIGIDARLEPGRHGGVEPWVIGMASGLSTLTDGPERYLFLVYPGASDWLAPYLSGPASLVEAAQGPPPDGLPSRIRRHVGAALPFLRRIWRRIGRGGALRATGAGTLPPAEGTLEAMGAQLIHFPFQSGTSTPLPTIYQPWDLQHRHLPGFFSPSTIRWREETYRALCANAALVVTASRWTKRDVMDCYGVPADRIAVVNVPPPLSAYESLPDEQLPGVAARLRLPSRFLLYPAQAWPHKNHLRLVAAVARLRDRGIDVPVVSTGRVSGEVAAIEHEAARVGVADLIRFTGFVGPSDLDAIYRLSWGLIFPSLFEGWGLPIVEAFASGVPVACSNVTSLPDLVGDAAIVFDPLDVTAIASAMETLWTDEEGRDELVRRGRARVARLTWPGTARRLRAHYRRILAATPSEDDVAILREEEPV